VRLRAGWVEKNAALTPYRATRALAHRVVAAVEEPAEADDSYFTSP
jgi:hypothetical protein